MKFNLLRFLTRSSSLLQIFLGFLFLWFPFQQRFRGAVDSFSRTLSLPDFPLPEAFSRKVHLFITDPLILIFTLLILFRRGLKGFFWSGPSKYLTLLFFTALASLTTSKTSCYFLQYFRLFEFSSVILVFNLIWSSRHKFHISTFIYRLSWVFLFVASFECLLSLYQYFNKQPLGLHFLGELHPYHFPFRNQECRRWLFDHAKSFSSLLFRASGTFSHPNILGGYLLCSLLACYHLWMQQGRYRLLLLFAISLQIASLCITFSRSAILAFLLSSLIYSLLQLKIILKTGGRASPVFKKFFSLSLAVFIVGPICLCLFYEPLVARGVLLTYSKTSHGADSERVQYQKIAIDMIKEHPFLGVGFNNFQLFVNPIQENYRTNKFFSKVHNIYLLIASETGLIGGGFFLLFLLKLLKRSCKIDFSFSTTTQAQIFLLSTFIGMLFIGGCDFYFIDTSYGRLLFFGFAALLCAVSPDKNAQGLKVGIASLK